MKKQVILFSLLSFFAIGLNAQSQLGIRNDNFAGINSTLLNPSGHMTTPFNWDVNLIEGHSFILNNYAYYVNSSILSLATNDEPFVYGPNNRLRDKPLEGNTLDFYDDDADRYLFAHGGIMGPSFFVRLNSNHALGLISRVRFSTSLDGIPNEISYYKFNSLLEEEQFTIQETNVGGLFWSEIGLNYLYQRETGNGLFGFGVTLKYLNGYEGAYVYNEDPITLFNTPGDSLRVETGSVNYAYTTTSTESSDFTGSTQSNGSGFAADIGVSFAGGQNDYSGYKWKLGVSLLDVGQITFNQNAQAHFIQTDTTVDFGGPEYRAYDRIEETEDALRYFSFQILGDSMASRVGNEFSMWLPTAASIQFDYAVANHIMINTTLVTGVPLGRKAVRRSTLIGVTPRYESRWLSLALPITYYNFDEIRYGLAARLGPFFIGTDDLGHFVSRSDLNGADFYAGIKINPILFGNKNGSKGIGGGSGGRNTVRCPQF